MIGTFFAKKNRGCPNGFGYGIEAVQPGLLRKLLSFHRIHYPIFSQNFLPFELIGAHAIQKGKDSASINFDALRECFELRHW